MYVCPIDRVISDRSGYQLWVSVGYDMAPITFGILTISDSCHKNICDDKSGPELERLVTDDQTETGRILRGQIRHSAIVPDDELEIMEKLTRWADMLDVNVILTTGGTGLSDHDVTPEATKKIIEKEAPGLSLAMLIASLKVTPMAMLSRPVCGIRGKTLIINLPGSSKAVRECLEAIVNVIPHAVDLILDRKSEIDRSHKIIQGDCTHSCSHTDPSISSLRTLRVTERFRESPYPMISMNEAEEIVNKEAKIGVIEVVNVWDACGQVIIEDIHSYCNLPPFRASIKDGYAVIASEGKGYRRVLGGMEAGHAPRSWKLVSGTCVRVNTGAPVPDEATAVVQVEDTRLVGENIDEDEELEIEILVEPSYGQDIRLIGSDIEKGALVLNASTKLGAVEMGILAACGYSKIKVIKRPTVGILSTGNELQEAGEPLKPGHIYDSNKITLMTMLKENGYASLNMGIAVDKKDVLIQVLNEALSKVDVLITSGSVSMGDKDLLKPILHDVFGATIHFGRVNMKPGKPTTFATCEYNGKTKYIMCLPGNPVSATVTAHLFALPLLNRLSGDYSKPVVVKAKLTSSYNLDPRPEYARVILEWNDNDSIPNSYSTGNQISSRLINCKSANALLMLPGRTKDLSRLNEGDVVRALLLGF